jgi:hypothetical protein
MKNPISIATRGRITPSVKRTLTLATIGWLTILGEPSTGMGLDSGVGEVIQAPQRNEYVAWRYDDEDILSIIKVFVQCQG